MLTRQPANAPRGRSTRDVITGVAALVALVALIGGVPYALIAFFGSPIPDEVPSLDSLTSELGAETLLNVLAILVWLAWAQLTVCVIVEVYAGIRGVGLPVRVPLSGGTQAVAHRLVVAALLLFAAGSAIMPALGGTRVVDPPKPVHTQSQPVEQAPMTPMTPEAAAEQIAEDLGTEPVPVHKEKVRKIYRVQPPHGRHHESLWEIADKCLGDGRRYKEIYSLNKGKQQPDGSRLTIASLIRPGWILDMPEDAVGVETVSEPGARGRGAAGQDQADTERQQPSDDQGADQQAPPEAGQPGGPGGGSGGGAGAGAGGAGAGGAGGAGTGAGGAVRQPATPAPPSASAPGARSPGAHPSGAPSRATPAPPSGQSPSARPPSAQSPSAPGQAPRGPGERPPSAPGSPGTPGQGAFSPDSPGAGRQGAGPAPRPTETPGRQGPGAAPRAPQGQPPPGAVPPPGASPRDARPGPGEASAAHRPPPGAQAPPDRHAPDRHAPDRHAADRHAAERQAAEQPPAASHVPPAAPPRAAPSYPPPPGAGSPTAGRQPPTPPEGVRSPSPAAQPAAPPAGPPSGPHSAPPSAARPAPPPGAGPQARPGVPAPGQAPAGAPAGARDLAAESAADRDVIAGDVANWSHGLAGASLLAAGLLAALGRRRREQLWVRAFGHRIPAPEDDAARAEQALRVGADTEATRLLDLGLRAMSKVLAAEGRTPPTVYGVHLSPGGLDLWIAPPDRRPPEPWEEYDNGQVWRLSAAALDGLNARHFSDVLAPYPGLVSIGTNDTGRILVDLEAAHGLVAVRGPEDARRAALAALAIELATNRWSDHMRITLIGFGEELSLIAPDRIRTMDSLAGALPELEARAEEVQQALAASGAESVLTGRCRGMFGEAWMPHYLIMADPPTGEEAERLVALARTGQRMAAGYVVAGDIPGATWTWDVNAEGQLQAGVLGFEVDAQLVPERHYRAVVELFRTAGRVESVPLPALGPDGEPTHAGANGGHSVDVRLLGAIEVEASGPMEESRRALATEVLVYLATHPQGVHPTVLGGAVWPRGVTASVRDSMVGRVADWLGRDSHGRPNLYYDDHGRIRLGSEVRVDWQMFRWLIWRSAAEPASETAYLAYALDLLRGPLLADRPPGRYAWLAVEKLEYEATAWVCDVAHRLVLMRLENREFQAAIHAARAGLRFAPDDEVLWRDLLRATHATGDQVSLRNVINDLRVRVERDPMIEQLQPETEALIDELLPEWRHEPVPYHGVYGGTVPGMPGGVAAGGL